MTKFVAMCLGVESEEYGPDKDSVVSGNPRFRLWSLDEAGSGNPHAALINIAAATEKGHERNTDEELHITTA
jgi:hypothetical protein